MQAKDTISFVLFDGSARIVSEQPLALAELVDSRLKNLLSGNFGDSTNFGPALKTARKVIGDATEACRAKVRKYSKHRKQFCGYIHPHAALTKFVCLLQLPLLIFMSDGQSQDGDSGDQEMEKLCEESQNRYDKLMVKTIGFGQGADREKLERLAAHVGAERGEYMPAVDWDGGQDLKQCFEDAAESLLHRF